MGYPKHIYDKAWQELDRKAGQARSLTAARRREVLERVPAVREIEREMALTATGITKTVISAPDDQAEALIGELARQNLALQDKRRTLLVENGFAPDYLEEQFGCPKCRDKGYIQNRMCGCLRTLLEAEAYSSLSSVAPVEQCTFEGFHVDLYPDTPDNTGRSPRSRMSDVVEYCRRYAEQFNPNTESLLLIGRTGLGKTHLSLAIAGTVTSRGYGVIYTPMQKLMDTLEAGKFSYETERREQYAEQVRTAQSCDLLVLDDLGTEFINQFSISVLYNIINTRQVEGRPTIISTNLEIEEIEERYSQRMLSRLLCVYKTLQFAGQDIRLMKRAQNNR